MVTCKPYFATRCPTCANPHPDRYKLNPHCGRHRPWPEGLCQECAPQEVLFSLQPYRHVDLTKVFCQPEMHAFIRLWEMNAPMNMHRAAFLYGRVTGEAANRGGAAVEVSALHKPPHKVDPAWTAGSAYVQQGTPATGGWGHALGRQ